MEDEDGAVPSYSNIENDPERWYDMPNTVSAGVCIRLKM